MRLAVANERNQTALGCAIYRIDPIIRRPPPLSPDVPFGKGFLKNIFLHFLTFSYFNFCFESMVNTVKMYQQSHLKYTLFNIL